MATKILAVNIGNSNIRFGVFNDLEVESSWTLNSLPHRTSDEYAGMIEGLYLQHHLRPSHISKIVVGSVVPKITTEMIDALRHIHKAEVVLVDRETLSKVTHGSTQIGTDLYANAVAANHFYSGKKLIIDFGTALTFTGIETNGDLIGVSIAPGVRTALDSLVNKTAQLPDIELKKPSEILGMDTETCMQSGIIFGYLSLIEGMIQRITAVWKSEEYTVIATGGMSHFFAPHTNLIHVDDKFHTIKGLILLADFKG